MSEGEKTRLVAWNRELSAAHDRLRRALRVARDAVDGASDAGEHASVRTDLLLYCHGFCVALGGHHVGEDVALFPELSARHPELRATIAKLTQDHEMIGTLLGQFERAIAADAGRDVLSRHLEGLAAIMESHFRYEERELLGILATLDLDADPADALGPL
ncbi:hemerythrin domain-containing protein [Microbacterium sp. No. 7]|uniref:hemerythrin domain-containing protein n=1 Tax=Microbacterium sp. No. 7 TaxID=1714373 RepID=UPI0006D0AC48|nr:hemerythrin domain-containing protein [Microbacterium sp. No. 7]ALJ18963.1 cation-binding protein [Microbacterium sp. No. 7]